MAPELYENIPLVCGFFVAGGIKALGSLAHAYFFDLSRQ